jgi:hypothetical protein
VGLSRVGDAFFVCNALAAITVGDLQKIINVLQIMQTKLPFKYGVTNDYMTRQNSKYQI